MASQWTFGRIGMKPGAGGKGSRLRRRRLRRQFRRYTPGVIPVVSELHPELNGFYRLEPRRRLRRWWRLVRVPGWKP